MSDERILHRLSKADGSKIGWMFWCPGCEQPHAVWVETPNEMTGARWTFDGNEESPTFNPSLDVHGEPHCHSFVRAGQIQFLSDCTHKLAGQTVPLTAW